MTWTSPFNRATDPTWMGEMIFDHFNHKNETFREYNLHSLFYPQPLPDSLPFHGGIHRPNPASEVSTSGWGPATCYQAQEKQRGAADHHPPPMKKGSSKHKRSKNGSSDEWSSSGRSWKQQKWRGTSMQTSTNSRRRGRSQNKKDPHLRLVTHCVTTNKLTNTQSPGLHPSGSCLNPTPVQLDRRLTTHSF